MNITDAAPGDIVRVNRKGRIFHAEVSGRTRSTLELVPLTRNINYHHARAREVTSHWRQRHALPRAATILPQDLVRYVTDRAEQNIGEVLSAKGGRYRVQPLDRREPAIDLRSRQLLTHYARPRRRAQTTPAEHRAGERDGS